jgi:hypothetical protein
MLSMQIDRTLRLALLTIGLGLAGCSDDTTDPSEDPNINQDLATSIGFSIAQDAQQVANPGYIEGSIGAGNEFRVSACTFTSTSGRFECPEETWRGFTLNRSYSFTDASGNALDAYDPTLVTGVNFQTSLTGGASFGNWSGTVDWTRDFSVTGISPTSTAWTWNGTGSSTISTSRHTGNGDTRTYNLQATTQLNDVVVPYPLTSGGYPTSGSITKNVTVTYVGGKFDGQTVTRTVTVTFNGTQTAELSIGSTDWDLNLATGAVTRRT